MYTSRMHLYVKISLLILQILAFSTNKLTRLVISWKSVYFVGVDTRVGLGYRLGNIGDAQVVWDIGPQLFTDPLRNEVRPYTQKRESGPPAGSHYFQSPSATATEKEVQRIEANKRMVQAAIQDHYRKDHFASVYPKPSQRSSSYHYDYSDHYHTYKDPTHSSNPKSSSSSSFFTSIPFADHFKGFWSGLTSGISGSEHDDSPSNSHAYNFDDVRSDFSTNLIKRSSNYADHDSRAYHARRNDEDLDDPTHSTLTEYERMLLQYGKDIGVANTKHGVVDDEPQASESGFFSRWFRNPMSSSKAPATAQAPAAQHSMEWGMGNDNEEHQNYRTIRPNSQAQKSVKKPSPSPSSATPYGSFTRRNTNLRRNSQRPQKRRSHNPFRNWLSSFKQSNQRTSSRPSPHAGGFGRRHFKRPSVSANPKLQHFTNTNKDLMMADANDDFIEGRAESYNNGDSYGQRQPISYNYADEFPDVDLTMAAPVAPKRYSPTKTDNYQTYRSKLRASLSQREKVIEPALLYDHLEVQDPVPPTEADESFHQRNKVVVNPALKQIEKQKLLGTQQPSASTLKPQSHTATLAKIQRLRLQNKLRASNATGSQGKQKIIVKIKGKGTPHMKHYPTLPSPVGGKHQEMSESTTSLPSVLSTISSMFSGTTKPKILNTLIHNATSLFPSITSIRILPSRKKKNREQMKTRLTVQNGKPAIVALPDTEEDANDEQEAAADGDDATPVVQVGHDMSFSDLQSIFAGAKGNGTNGSRRRIRIRVKESVLKGTKKENDDKERKDSDEDENDEEGKDIFVDIESGEVSVLKPVASLVSFNPKQEEASDEEEVDYYEDDDGDGVADADMNRKEHIFAAIQKELVKNFEKMKKTQQRAEAKKRRKQELAEKGMDESIDVITKYFDQVKDDDKTAEKQDKSKLKPVGGLSK